MTCPHLNFEAVVEVARIEDRVGLEGGPRLMAHVQVRCAECKTRCQFVGLPMGLDFQKPMVSVDGFELRAPLQPNAHLTSLMAGDPDTGFPLDRPPRT